MTTRLNIVALAPDAVKGLMAVEASIAGSGIEHGLLELVRLRASQINGCAYCIHMHVTDALKNGETDMRMHLLAAWRDSSVFTDRERAALNWTETLTHVSREGAPNINYAVLQSQFNAVEVANLTVLIGTINLWNRLQIGLHAVAPLDAPTAIAA